MPSKKKNHKFIFIIGGVMSGVGKGIASSSISQILQSKGYRVNPVKVDPYLNVDAGTMNPTEHGEVFVLSSGLETDQDMGNYERFLNTSLGAEDYMTSGMVYKSVIEKERNLGYGGKCVEAIPHITEEIKKRLKKSAEKSGSDISVVEIGGTVGDYQNVMFIEAARMMAIKNPKDIMFIMVTFLPIPGSVGEMKTKPTQNAIRALNSYGVQPHMIIARASELLDDRRKDKIAISCSILKENVISAPDIKSIYDVPINFEKEKIGEQILKTLSLNPRKGDETLKKWSIFVKKSKNGHKEIDIAIIGKYFDTGDFVLSDAYISVIEAIKFSAYHNNIRPKLHWLNAKDFEKGQLKVSDLKKYKGIIVPGGFGESGIEGKLEVIEYARKNKIPYLGLCYGMQLLVIEYARNVLGLQDANTSEINPNSKNPVIDIIPDQKKKITEKDFGGSMRLGAYPAILKKGTIAFKAYKKESISERHRHRYEVNPEYIAKMENAGLVFSGRSPDGRLMEIAELPKSKHPFFLGVQFHPEFQARPLAPHPLFNAFIRSTLK